MKHFTPPTLRNLDRAAGIGELPVKTSETDPLALDIVKGFPGPLALTFCPGKKGMGRGCRWDRDLDADLKRIKENFPQASLVALLETTELQELGVANIQEKAEAMGFGFRHSPIIDQMAPSVEQANILIDWILGETKKRAVVLFCRGGLGRTGLVAACALSAKNGKPLQSITLIRQVRSGAIETRIQEQFVAKFTRQRKNKR